MKDVLVKLDVPILVAKEAIKLGHGWVVLLIAPSVPSVLEMDFF